jgi:hypothetical protein
MSHRRRVRVLALGPWDLVSSWRGPWYGQKKLVLDYNQGGFEDEKYLYSCLRASREWDRVIVHSDGLDGTPSPSLESLESLGFRKIWLTRPQPAPLFKQIVDEVRLATAATELKKKTVEMLEARKIFGVGDSKTLRVFPDQESVDVFTRARVNDLGGVLLRAPNANCMLGLSIRNRAGLPELHPGIQDQGHVTLCRGARVIVTWGHDLVGRLGTVITWTSDLMVHYRHQYREKEYQQEFDSCEPFMGLSFVLVLVDNMGLHKIRTTEFRTDGGFAFQFPLLLTFALSIKTFRESFRVHALRGTSVALGPTKSPGMLYSVVSRLRTLDHLFLDPRYDTSRGDQTNECFQRERNQHAVVLAEVAQDVFPNRDVGGMVQIALEFI